MGKQAISKVVGNLVKGAFSHNQQRKAQKSQAKQAVASVRANVMVNKQSNNDPIYPMYGLQRMGGTRVFVEASNGAGAVQGIDAEGEATNTEYLNMVIAMCEGNIGDITQLWFNDTIVWDSAVNGTKSALASGGYQLANFMTGTKYSGANMYVAWYPGISGQLTDATLSASVGSGVWGSNHRLQGISYLAFKLQANEKFGGQLPTFNATLKGKEIIDVSQLTNGDTAPLPAGTYTTSANQNPADIMYDYLIHPFYGKGLDRLGDGTYVAGTNINIASFQQAKIDCDAARGGSGYPLNGFLQTDKQIFDNISEILETCNGMILFVNGKYEFRIRKKNEQLNLPTNKIFDSSNIIGEIALSLPAKSAKLNKVTGTFNNAAEKYNDDIVVFSSAAFQLEDNGSILEEDEGYTMITDASLVTDLVTQRVNISRDLFSISFTVSHIGLTLKAGDVVEVRQQDFGWGIADGQYPYNVQQFFRIQELKLTDENTVEIAATTYNSALEL